MKRCELDSDDKEAFTLLFCSTIGQDEQPCKAPILSGYLCGGFCDFNDIEEKESRVQADPINLLIVLDEERNTSTDRPKRGQSTNIPTIPSFYLDNGSHLPLTLYSK